MTSIKSIDHNFWINPPWGNGKEKYRLGLKPIEFNEIEIDKIYKVVKKHKNKVNLETLDPENGIKWNLG